MKHFIYMAVTLGIFVSCSNCEHKKVIEPKSNRDTSVVVNVDTLDSLPSDDSLMVNVYEIVDDSSVSHTSSQPSTSVKVSKRGEVTENKVNDDYTLQGNGIGMVRIGTDITKLPSQLKGLYDKKKNEGGELLLYNGNDLILEVAYNKKTNLINTIRVTSASIKTEDGISQFMDLNTLMKNDRVKKAIGNKNKYNIDSFDINGITYELEENIEGEKYVSAIIIK